MFKNILAPVTPSWHCEQAADAGIAFARRFDANLTLMHVHGFEHRWGEAELMNPGEVMEKIKAGVTRHYAEKLKGVPNHKILVTQGVPHVEILRVSRESNSDLIVMCPSDKDEVDREFLVWTRIGSTLEQVSRQARCPVLIVTRTAPYGEDMFRNLLVATDFTPQAGHVVDYAGQMARRYNAGLTVLNILNTDTTARDMPQEEIAREISARKDRMASEYAGPLKDVRAVAFECWEGQPTVEILKVARVENMDLILMAHHGREKDPEKALLGSTVAHVARNSLCPVMTLNHHFTMRMGAR